MKIYGYFIALLCLQSSATKESLETSTIGEIDTTPLATAPALDDAVANAVNKFGFNLLKTIMKSNEHENIVLSPTSISGLLAMTMLGSAGTTYDELAQLLGFTQDIITNRYYHEEFGAKLSALNANDTRTLYANVAFVDTSARLREVYRGFLQRVYRGDALPADFGAGDAARQTINEWVKNNTGDRIMEFLQQPLPASTQAVLLSALYFSGQWATPFVPEYTAPLPFKTATKDILVDLMANFGHFNYLFSREHGLQMIALPYNDSVTNMYVIKPRFSKRENISALIDRLDYESINRLIDQMSLKKCVIRFPKMKLESKVDLKGALVAMGASTMFVPGKANFAVMLESSKISNDSNAEDELISRIAAGEGEGGALREQVNRFTNPGVHVDSVLHEVKMTVDEYGTEAVAATSAIMARTAELFYADSPFYLFIRNERTKLVTFSALVVDPTL